MGDTPGPDDENKKERGPVGKMLFKVGERLGIVEQTRLAPEFIAEIEKYYKYQDAVEKIVGRMEAALQNDAKVLADGLIECPEKTDPYEQFAKEIKAFRQFQPEDKKESTVTVEAIVKRLALMQRETQTKGRRSIRKMRRFIAGERSAMMEEQKKLMKARDAMDAARHEVKQTRTNEMVEEKGRLYERSVHEFDTQAAKVASYPEKMPDDKESHQKEILEYFEVLATFHQNAAAMLSEHLSRLGVQSPITAAAALSA